MERAEGLLGGTFLFKFLLKNDGTIDKTKVVAFAKMNLAITEAARL